MPKSQGGGWTRLDTDTGSAADGLASSDRMVEETFCVKRVVALAFGLRLLLVVLGGVVDGLEPFGLRYTDVDYLVLRDGAQEMLQGSAAGPYARATFRYTPLLALPLAFDATWGLPLGKVLFCALDAVLGGCLEALLRSRLPRAAARRVALVGWHLNPVAMNLCTRGSCDAVVAFLVAAALVVVGRQGAGLLRPGAAGALLGLATHVKIYPAIHGPAFALHCLASGRGRPFRARLGSASCFGLGFLACFLLPTAAAYAAYGDDYLDNALLYHVGRLDHRHNFSVFWLPIYAVGALEASPLLHRALAVAPFAAHAAFQGAAIAGLRDDLELCVFAQTALFVTANKVATAQYFAWWLPFAVLNVQAPTVRLRTASLAWAASLALWLGGAYLLEFRGARVHAALWGLSLAFFLANVDLVLALVDAKRSRDSPSRRH